MHNPTHLDFLRLPTGGWASASTAILAGCWPRSLSVQGTVDEADADFSSAKLRRVGGGENVGRRQEVRNVVQRRPAVPVSQQEALGEHDVLIKRSSSVASRSRRRGVGVVHTEGSQGCRANLVTALCAVPRSRLFETDHVGQIEPLWGLLH